ncbi:MAG: efflux transporter outer membrane subunit [Rhodospirillales bacterium]|nr:efflux transporter outer membrane subunit [Rhodospirillales bacterium]
MPRLAAMLARAVSLPALSPPAHSLPARFRLAPRALAFAGLALLGGCTVGPNFHRPGWKAPFSWLVGHPRPAAAVPSTPVVAPVRVAWWSLFDDPILTKLERQVAADNLDVRTATIRLAESRAELGITGAARYPVFNANGTYQREKASNLGVFSQSGNGSSTSSGITAAGPTSAAHFPPFDLFQYGFDASWEPDIWGQVKREMEAAGATVRASADARRGVLLTALAEVARDYIDLRGTQQQLRIARENLHTAKQGLKLTQDRAAAGVTTDLDVANASAQVRITAAEIPTLQQREQDEINALSLLLGRPPGALASELAVPRPVPPVPPRIPVGFPSQLLLRRPDIRAAVDTLHKATADVGVAVANFYPSFTLSASAGFQALQFGNLWKWDARQYNLGPSFTIPIFQGGQLKYTLTLRKAQQREAAVAYEKTVLSAWHEVDNALTAYQDEQLRRAQLIGAVKDNRRALALAQSRYQQGVADFLTVLDAERSLLSAEQQLALSTTTVSTNLVAIYKALGGGWESSYPAAPPDGVTAARPAKVLAAATPPTSPAARNPASAPHRIAQ